MRMDPVFLRNIPKIVNKSLFKIVLGIYRYVKYFEYEHLQIKETLFQPVQLHTNYIRYGD